MATSRSSRAPEGLNAKQKVMAGGLCLVILVALGWSMFLLFGSKSEVTLVLDKKVDQVQFDISKAVMTEQNKTKFQSVQILTSSDGTKVEIKGTVDKKEDLDELNAVVEKTKNGFPTTVDVKVVPRKSGL